MFMFPDCNILHVAANVLVVIK